jgi:SPX domain protein involved in polyphosphate accumulation
MNSHTDEINPKLHFQRFEFKYPITPDEEKEIKSYLRRYVDIDPFAQNTKTGSYEVFSLYYDSPAFYYYHEKIDGVIKRKKVRLRTYRNDGQFAKYAFFEFKRKHDVVILKDRFLLPLHDYTKLIGNHDFVGTSAIRDQNQKKIIEEFEWEQHLRSIRPQVLITYTREPFLGKYNKNFRITFDKDIKAIQNDNLFYAGNDYADVSRGITIMEIKYNGVLPFYINDIIQNFNLDRAAYSKYCNGVEGTGALSASTHPGQHLTQLYNYNLPIYLPNQKSVWETF